MALIQELQFWIGQSRYNTQISRVSVDVAETKEENINEKLGASKQFESNSHDSEYFALLTRLASLSVMSQSS